MRVCDMRLQRNESFMFPLRFFRLVVALGIELSAARVSVRHGQPVLDYRGSVWAQKKPGVAHDTGLESAVRE